MLEQKHSETEPQTVVEIEFEEPLTEEEPQDELETIEGAEALRAAGREMAGSMSVRDYKGAGTNLGHGHDRDKHDVRAAFNVNDKIVENFFHFDPADHAAPHELAARKEEFVNSDTPVFTDTSDTDSARWNKIENACTSAPIPDEAHRTLDRISSKQV